MADLSDVLRYMRENAAAVLNQADRDRPSVPVSAIALANLVAALDDSLSARAPGSPGDPGTQFHAVLECRQDPCRGLICGGRPARRFPVDSPGGPFASEDAAREHGKAQARLVYGWEHRVLVEGREVGPWAETR